MSKADRRARKRQNQQLAQQQRAALQKRTQRNKTIQRGVIVAVAVVVVVGAIYLFGGDNGKKKVTAKPTTTLAPTTTVAPTTVAPVLPAGCVKTAPKATGPKKLAKPTTSIDPSKTYTATIVTSCGTMQATLAAKDSPVAVANFVYLAQHHFYDGLTWHRVVKDFVIQGGDPQGNGAGGPGYTVKGEVPKSGKYPLGGLAAAKTSADPNGTMGSQFFVITGAQGQALPPQYAYFGVVTKGLEAAKKIESLSTGDGPPSIPMYILKITVTES